MNRDGIKRIRWYNLSIRTKLFIAIGGVLVFVVVGSTSYLLSWQNFQSEQAFRDRLTGLATASPMMIHSAAEEYSEKLGFRYYRVNLEQISEATELGKLEHQAAVRFLSNTDLQSVELTGNENGVPWMHVFVPGRIRVECLSCHQANGLDVFGSKKVGEVAAVFDIASPMTELLNQKADARLLILIIGAGLIIAVGVVLHFFMKRFVTRPIYTLVGIAGAISMGDLTVRVPVTANDEVGRLGTAVNDMVDQLREALIHVAESSSAVASASSEISSSTEQMAAGAQEQASEAREVASAVEEMTKTIIENSKNAGTTASTAKQAKRAAEHGGKVVEETVEGMRRIAEVVNKSADTVKALGKSSDQIGEIIGVIDDIADQTNLLALNAAIEAARAGEQGRGFAVVADEVRKLAERTTKATKEITGMIKAIQLDTTGAVTSMNEGTKQVDEGIKLVDNAGSSLHEIVEVSQKVTDMVSQIAIASEEQSTASEQISKNVEAISSVTNETATGVQQITRAAEDLNRLTENLQQLLDRFKLTDGSAKHKISASYHETEQRSGHEETKSRIAVGENSAWVSHE